MRNARDDNAVQPKPAVSEAIARVSALLDQPLPDPHAGQLWRASWGEDLVLCLVLETNDDHWVEVAPIALDDDIGDIFSLVCDDSLSPLGVDFTVLAGLSLALKEYVLDAFFGEVDPRVLDLGLRMRDANIKSREPDNIGMDPEIVRAGSSEASGLDEKRDFRIEISHQLSRVASARFLPEASEESASLHHILQELGLRLSDVRRALNVSLPIAREIVSGAETLRPDQVEALAGLPGLSRASLARIMPKLQSGYLSAVQRPAVSKYIRREANRANVDLPTLIQTIPSRIASRRQHNYDSEGRSRSSEEDYWRDAVIALLAEKRVGH